MIRKLRNLFKDERGEDVIKYALLVSLIALAVIGAVKILGTTISNIFNDIVEALTSEG